jgi:ABC-type transport system involved in multi-copper enzyme maturation permease subunit
MNRIMTLVKKECAENFLVFRAALMFIVACVLMSVFSVLLISNTELSLLDNAQAIYMLTTIILIVGSLLALVQGSDAFAGERERDTLEVLLISPVNGRQVSMVKLFNTLFSWLVLFVLSLPYMWAIGGKSSNLISSIVALFVTGTLCVSIIGGLALILSLRSHTLKGSLLPGMTIFLLLISPVALGPGLRNNVIGRIVDNIDPLMGAINTLDSVIIDSQGVPFQLIRISIMLSYSIFVIVGLHLLSRRIKI